MVHPCDKPCGNKTASGYCATTACINPQYSNLGKAQYGQGVQKRIVTNYDLIRSKSVEELAEFLAKVTAGGYGMCAPGHYDCTGKESCAPCWLDWLKQEAAWKR